MTETRARKRGEESQVSIYFILSVLFPFPFLSRYFNSVDLRLFFGVYNHEAASGFSVAFGSTGCRCSGSGRARFVPMARTLSARGTISWGGAHIKMQSPVFPGP